METLGLVFLVVIGLAVLIGLVMVVVSLPDLSRYLRVKRM
jgi:hypothetical protein